MQQRGGAVMTALLGLSAAAVLAFLCLIGAAFYLAHNIRVTGRHGRTLVETPFGSVRVRQGVDPRLLGMPVYPGAVRTPEEPKLASIELDLPGAQKEFNVVAAAYTTDDPATRVVEFYQDRLGSCTLSESHSGGSQVICSGGGFKRIIKVTERSGRTYIELASVGEAASN